MLGSYVVGVLGLAVLLAAWLGVQRAWSRVFPDAAGDPDALAGRLGCHGCGCRNGCERRTAGTPAARQEETT